MAPQVVTRFPPEPNGYLHIGHAKAMFVDFGFAAKRGGKCFLRFDDTNPEAESPEYIEHIKEIVRWMGWTYCEITYSSNHFQTLYEFAVRLIREGKAYVCHQTGDEIKATREERGFSPWRDRPVAESLRLFEDMRRCALPPATPSATPPTPPCFSHRCVMRGARHALYLDPRQQLGGHRPSRRCGRPTCCRRCVV